LLPLLSPAAGGMGQPSTSASTSASRSPPPPLPLPLVPGAWATPAELAGPAAWAAAAPSTVPVASPERGPAGSSPAPGWVPGAAAAAASRCLACACGAAVACWPQGGRVGSTPWILAHGHDFLLQVGARSRQIAAAAVPSQRQLQRRPRPRPHLECHLFLLGHGVVVGDAASVAEPQPAVQALRGLIGALHMQEQQARPAGGKARRGAGLAAGTAGRARPRPNLRTSCAMEGGRGRGAGWCHRPGYGWAPQLPLAGSVLPGATLAADRPADPCTHRRWQGDQAASHARPAVLRTTGLAPAAGPAGPGSTTPPAGSGARHTTNQL
jgi:hypothetical protein